MWRGHFAPPMWRGAWRTLKKRAKTRQNTPLRATHVAWRVGAPPKNTPKRAKTRHFAPPMWRGAWPLKKTRQNTPKRATYHKLAIYSAIQASPAVLAGPPTPCPDRRPNLRSNRLSHQFRRATLSTCEVPGLVPRFAATRRGVLRAPGCTKSRSPLSRGETSAGRRECHGQPNCSDCKRGREKRETRKETLAAVFLPLPSP